MKLLLMLAGFTGALLFTGCSEDEPFATITTTTNASELDGDVTGDGGSASRTFAWNNSRTTAEYNMDITSTKGGSMNLVIKDADGTVVLDRTLQKGVGDDSASGVSNTGIPGEWEVTITLTNFNGDGSFSISQGT